jgi:hypothetical protein
VKRVILHNLDWDAHVDLFLAMVNGASQRFRAAASVTTAGATATATAAAAIGAFRGARARTLATGAASLRRRHPTGSNIIHANATAATSAISFLVMGWGGHTSAVATLAASLSRRDIVGSNVVGAQTAAAATAGHWGNLGRTANKLEKANAHQNAHDGHGKQRVHNGQDEHARKHDQLENATCLPVMMLVLATHVCQHMGRKRRNESKFLSEVSGNGSLDIGVVVDSLKNAALEVVVPMHASSKLGKTTVKQEKRSNAQDSV